MTFVPLHTSTQIAASSCVIDSKDNKNDGPKHMFVFNGVKSRIASSVDFWD